MQNDDIYSNKKPSVSISKKNKRCLLYNISPHQLLTSEISFKSPHCVSLWIDVMHLPEEYKSENHINHYLWSHIRKAYRRTLISFAVAHSKDIRVLLNQRI